VLQHLGFLGPCHSLLKTIHVLSPILSSYLTVLTGVAAHKYAGPGVVLSYGTLLDTSFQPQMPARLLDSRCCSGRPATCVTWLPSTLPACTFLCSLISCGSHADVILLCGVCSRGTVIQRSKGCQLHGCCCGRSILAVA
jgi:hypothetical protein